MSYIKKKVRIRQNHAIIDKNNRPIFSYGQSVFRERRKLTDKLKFWKKSTPILLWPEGSNRCFNFSWPEDKSLGAEATYSVWTQDEAREYVKKQKAKAGIQKNPLTGWPLIILMALNVITVFILVWRLL
jgi:hypothetical protein